MSISDCLVAIYSFLDDWTRQNPTLAQWRRSNNHDPAFTDAEVLTVALMQPVLGHDNLARTYRLIRDEYRTWFPDLVTYARLIARLNDLSEVVGTLFEHTAARLSFDHRRYLADSKPIPVCKSIRHGRVRLLREDGAYFGKSSSGWYFGFCLHVLTDARGWILNAVLTPGHINDRAVLPELASVIDGGLVVSDHGYHGVDFANSVFDETGLLVVCTTDLAKPQRKLLSQMRQRVETTLSRLWRGFVDRVFSRSFVGLWQSIKIQLLHHNLCLAGIIK